MKRNALTIAIMLTLALIIPFVLAACAQPTAIEASETSDDIVIYIPEPEESPPIDLFTIPITEENRIALRDSIFIGEGAGLVSGGDEWVWYVSIFDMRADSIHGYIMDIPGQGAWERWLAQFPGYGGARNRREATLRSFIEDNNITKEDIINAQELVFERPREEIEELVNWARHGTPTVITDRGIEYFWERVVFSLSDLDALFSGDVQQIMDAFPGYGVIHNGNGYSPEWILNNIEAAVVEHQIPESEIWRIISMAEDFYQLDEVVSNAIAFLENGPIEITGSGDVNGDGVVDFLDLLMLVYYLDNNGNIPPDMPFVRESADLNGDGVIDELDLQLLMHLLDNQD